MSDKMAAGAAPRVELAEALPTLPLVDGIVVRPIMGDRLNIQEVVLIPGAVAPVHTHAEEQLGYVVSGTCEFTDGQTHWQLGPGDCYHAPSGAPHGARALAEGCVIVDAFAPPREQVVRMLAERDATAGSTPGSD
jgi:quercetin dioxygenase-like cupin family protein